MKIVSWNINSIRIRIKILKILCEKYNPDIICLQETKTENKFFPLKEIRSLGFEYILFEGEKSYNGVSILSKIPFKSSESINILNSGQKRHLLATLSNGVKIHNFYVPAGGDIPDQNLNPKFDFKIKFLDWMIDYFRNYSEKDRVVITGDMNIAPLENDVYSHKALLSVVSHTPIEVKKILDLQKTLNWVDCNRFFVDEKEKLYSWWSYRARDPFKSNRGRRLDHIWVTQNLKNNILKSEIIKEFRILDRPSDHVPVIAEITNIKSII